MMPIKISLTDLQKRLETKAYVYGVSPVVCTLLGEYLTELIKPKFTHVPKG